MNKDNTTPPLLEPVDRTTINRSQQLLAELANILFYQSIYTILTGHALAVIITVIFLWDTVNTNWLLIWSTVLIGQSLYWVYRVGRYRYTQPPAEQSQKWINLFPMAAIITGSLWGMTIYWPGVIDNPTSLVLLDIMVLGVTAAGLAVFAPYLRSYVAFTGFILVPFITRFFTSDNSQHWTLGTMFLLYLIVILISGHNMRRAVRKSIDLRIENIDLVNDLSKQNIQAEQAKEEAVQADLSKSKFLAAASHDLRQPLHALGLFVDALENRITYPEVRNIVDNIRISTDALSDLLNSLLDISKLDAGVLEPKPTDFLLKPILQRIQTDFDEVASSKSLRLEVIDCDFVIHTDPSMLERILRNLVSNAIRYTNKGHIKLDCQLIKNQVQIEVHDTGIGIASEQQLKIFEEFYQIENPERDRRKGLGLGLAIVKRLADLLTIQLALKSTPNQGSTFSVTVPFVDSISSQIAQTTQFTDDLQNTRVMVIDDEAMIRLGMRNVLEEWHCMVLEAESIQQAMDHLSSDCHIDMILTDYRLRNNETGIEAIRRIHDHCLQTIPAIILTGDTDPQRIREAKDSGFHLLHKPVSPAKLRSLMSYLLEESRKKQAEANTVNN
ncbi:MAG: hybrid sensor histidine kinase/response regulator [Gammaproteobacteria bacterium]|nr:hybrid sensor histidine kinase/response regulator [Gammaproteobacteria bacterium]